MEGNIFNSGTKYLSGVCMYTIALQNTDVGMLQKSSNHLMISIFFQSGEWDAPPSLTTRYAIVYDNSRPPPPPPNPGSWIRHCYM